MMVSAEIPGTIGAYRVGERLGGGGFGEVYAATHEVLGGEVAIKILHRHRCTDPDAVRRFVDEARAVNKIHHAGIVDIFDFGVLSDGRSFFVMERIHGHTLRQILDDGGLARDRAIETLRAIALAVDAAHAVGIAHRDLKPDNVFVLPTGEIKLIDFGLAKLSSDASVSASALVIGTPLYMSPEQCRGTSADTRSDLYSFGALAYHVLTKTPVFEGDPLALALHHVNDPPERPSHRAAGISSNTDRVLLALLNKDPALRPAPLAAAVEDFAAPSRTRRLRVIVPAVAVAALVGGLVALVHRDHATPASASRTDVASIVVTRVKLDDMIWPYPWLTFDGEDLVSLGPPKGTAIRHLASGHVDLVSTPMGNYHTRLPDGRWVSSLQLVTIDDPTVPGGQRTLAKGALGEASPCGDQVAFFAGSQLQVVDVATGVTTALAAAIAVAGVRWSPDCRRLLWGTADGVLHVVELATRQITDLPVQVLGSGDFYMMAPGAFLDPDTIAYCASEADRPVLRLHRLSEPGPDPVIAQLDPKTFNCHIVGAARRHRVAVVEDLIQTTPAIVDLTADRPTLRRVGGEGNPIAWLAFADDRTLIVGRVPAAKITPGLPVMSSERVELATGDTTRLTGCPGELGVLRRSGALAHVVHRDGKLELLATDTCSVVDGWRISADDGWSMPSCTDARCVIARASDNRITVYELVDGQTRELGSFEDGLVPGPRTPVVALVGNGFAVSHSDFSGRYGVFSLDTPAHHLVTLDQGNSLGAGRFVAGPDGQHFYADGHNLDVPGDSVTRIDANDVRETVFDPGPADNSRTVLSLRAISPDGHTLALIYTRREHGLLVVDSP